MVSCRTALNRSISSSNASPSYLPGLGQVEPIHVEIRRRAPAAGQDVFEEPLHGPLDGDEMGQHLLHRPLRAVLVNLGAKLIRAQRI